MLERYWVGEGGISRVVSYSDLAQVLAEVWAASPSPAWMVTLVERAMLSIAQSKGMSVSIKQHDTLLLHQEIGHVLLTFEGQETGATG